MQRQLLPANWQLADLGDISSDISYGYTASATSEPTGVKLLRITDIQNNTVNWPNVPNCKIEPEKVGKYRLKPRDLVFARTGATVGKSYLLKGEIPESVYASYLIRVRCLEGVSIEFLANYFQSPYYWLQITDFSAGIGQPNVNGTKLKNLSVPLPPLAEQKVIADKLDTLLTQVENAKARLERIPQILKRFRQSVLAAAVNGRLTEEWRGDREFTSETAVLGEVAKFIDYRGRTPQKTSSGIPLITAKNIRQGYISRAPREFIANEAYDSWMTRGIPSYGDVLITTEAPMGYVANIDIQERFALAQRAICLKFAEGISPYYASIYMQSYEFQKALSDNSTGTTVKGIKAALLKKIAISIPSPTEQTEIVRRVDQLFAHADRIEQQVNNALARVNNLTQSILAKAFRGELTEQWRKDNPALISGEHSAAALLERIKSERAAQKPAGRRTKIKKTEQAEK